MKKIFFTLCLLLIFGVGFSQIKPNENLLYVASYNMSGLMTQLAQVSIQTKAIQTSKKTYLQLKLEAATYTKWDSYFKIRDVFESYVDPETLKPSLYKRSTNEGGYSKIEKYIFKADGRTVNSTVKKRNKPEIQKTFTIGGSTLDVVSLVFKLRTIDFKNVKNGQTKSFIIVFDEKEYPVTVKFMGTEMLSAGNLGTKECYKLSVAAKTNKLKGVDKNIIWLTADANKIPVLIKFSIPVGTGQVKLSNATGI